MRVWGCIIGHCLQVCLARRWCLCVTLALPLEACAAVPAGPRVVLHAHVGGLQRGDVAHVQLLPGEPETAASLAARGITLLRRKTSNGQWSIDVGSLPDGAYAWQIQAPSPYFRAPKGYAFRVKQAQVVDGQDFVFRFYLIPPRHNAGRLVASLSRACGSLDYRLPAKPNEC
jgi:hypothetical protein